MKKLFFILFLLPLCALAQVTDNFSDGNFTSNPTWSGNDVYFMVSNQALQSNGPHANGNTLGDTIFMSTPNSMINNTEWSFLVNLSFNPTSDNVFRVYLVSDSADVRYNLEGYYIEMGQTTSDYIRFYKQSGNTSTLLFTGMTAFPGNISTRIKITHDSTGNWNVFSDVTGTGLNYVSEGSAFSDNTFTTTSFLGVYCRYKTDSRYNQYYFDDFYVGPVVYDTIPPVVQSVDLDSTLTIIDVSFSEDVDQVTSENVTNYNVLGVGNPQTAILDGADKGLVHLTYSLPFTQGVVYSLEIGNVKDISGNAMVKDTLVFSRYYEMPFDVVINEIMADPEPPKGLPDFEYLELYNRTQIPIKLGNWTLTIGTTIKTLPDSTISPNGYVIVSADAAIPLLMNYVNNAPVIGLSSLSLSNTGTSIALANENGRIIHFISYTDSWYQNTTKDDGGWSLEQIDPSNPCGEKANWKASADPSGGTPGRVNSVNGSHPDLNPPLLVRASASRKPEDSSRVKIYYNEPLFDKASVYIKTKYIVDNGIGNPDSVKLILPENKCIELVFAAPLQHNILYTLSVTDSIFDCSGNKSAVNQTVRFGIPELPDSADLVINEVLADPKEGGADFVEIYNRSNKVLDFADLSLLSLTDSASITSENFLSLPGFYTVLTTDPEAVKSQYNTPNPYNFIDMESFPSLNNDAGDVILATFTNLVVDAMHYTSDMHFPLLNSTDGVSLERVSYDRSASDITNWHSASEPVGYATPAYQNSQFMADVDQDGSVTIDPEIFSPDNDGYNDVLNIRCKSETPGKMLNITVYDSKGRLIKYLVKNQLMSEENVYSWDGITEKNLKANVGVYIVYVEMLDMQGKVNHFKKTAVLATKL